MSETQRNLFDDESDGINQPNLNFEQSDMDWLKAHGAEGILSKDDVAELQAGVRRVYELMKDLEWHTPYEICQAAGTNGFPAMEGLRRLRDLYPIMESAGFYRRKKLAEGTNRFFLYRFSRHKQNDD